MNDEPSLFGEEPTPDAPVPPAVTPFADWQIDLLRKALGSRGLTTMSERQSAIEPAAHRPVESLRALTHDEGLQVLSRLGQAPTSGRVGKSAWDDRDEDTWIERLQSVRSTVLCLLALREVEPVAGMGLSPAVIPLIRSDLSVVLTRVFM